ncbi:MAG: cytochrome c biogenesis protein CcsA [Phycisphaerae bacterium]
MTQLLTCILGGLGFAIGAVCSYLRLRHHVRWAPAALRVAVTLALAANVGYLAGRFRNMGVVETFRYSFDDAILLATLLGLMGISTHLARTLRGVDGFLFIMATALQCAASAIVNQPEMRITGRAWFVSHSIAFAISGTLFIAGGVAGVAYLLVNWMLRRKRPTTLVGNVASLESLERFGRWMPIIGFPFFTYGILTGLCGVSHRPDLQANDWYLDPVFVSSLLAWAVFGYLCYGSLYKPQIRGKRAAVLSTYGLGLIVVAYLFRVFFSLMHA